MAWNGGFPQIDTIVAQGLVLGVPDERKEALKFNWSIERLQTACVNVGRNFEVVLVLSWTGGGFMYPQEKFKPAVGIQELVCWDL